jgi:predicted TIM-barrel fold metal-dependent hydrolase
VIPFADTHFHLWDREQLHYPWLESGRHPVLGSIGAISQSHVLEDYLHAIEGLGVRTAVHVQADASDPLRETEWLDAVADEHGWPHAIVAFVDLTADDWEQGLAQQASFARVRGIRDLRVLRLGARRDWSDPRLEHALRALGAHGLHYELRVTPTEAADAAALLARIDGVPVVLTHAGLPLDRSPGGLEEWTRAIRTLAQVDHLHCKLSGFGMSHHLAGERWSTTSVRPLVETCLEHFGTARTFFGSNWPVETLAVPYDAMLATYRTIVGGLTIEEGQDLLWRNASRFYRVER